MVEEWREVTADWLGEFAFKGQNPSGSSVQMGSLEGQPGMSPMELLLLGLAGCTGMDIVSILGKKREKLEAFQVVVRGRRAEKHPKAYTDIEVIYRLWGKGINPKSVEQAIQLSEEKYCSAGVMLKASANISSKYVIYETEEEKETEI